MQPELLRATFCDLLGIDAVDLLVDEQGTSSVLVAPATEEEVAQVLAFATQHQLGVVPQGHGSQSYLGGIVTRQNIVLSLRRLDQMVEYSPADLTVTVQAGVTVTHLQELLRTSGQWLALDPVLRDDATVGGIISTNASGPKRMMYGALRDQVIGMRVAYPDGKVIKMGGKVVKNVAGYDMSKLFIGSLGTLGVITEVTFKLHPLPKEPELVFLRPASFVDAERVQRAVLDSELIPSCLELLSPTLSYALGGANACTILVGCDEGVSNSAYQRERLREIAGSDSIEFMQGTEVESYWQRYRRLLSKPNERVMQVKASLLPMQVVPFLRWVTEQAERSGLHIDTSASLGTGILRLYVAAIVESNPPLLAILMSWRDFVERQQGAFVIERAPDWLKQSMSVWGTERGEFMLMRGIKQAIDPTAILNMGRFVGGI